MAVMETTRAAMHHLRRSPCAMAAASMYNLAGRGAQFRQKRCTTSAESSPRSLYTPPLRLNTSAAEVERPGRRS